MADRCKPGDLAVIIQAQHRENLGLIVKVLEPHDRTGPLVYNTGESVWLTESAVPMKWTLKSEVYLLKRGPIPAAQLQPIRARPTPRRKRTRQIKVLEAV